MSIRNFLLVLAVMFLTTAYAQAQKTTTAHNISVSEEGDLSERLNIRDAKKRKQGMWFFQAAPLRGEPGYMEFGNYLDDRKSGTWYRLDVMGRLMSMQNYRKGVLDGEAQYYERGKLICSGTFRGLDPDVKLDSFYVTNPLTLDDSLVVLPSEIGTTRHGIWRYYDPLTGQLTKEEEYQVDELIRKKDFIISAAADSGYIKKHIENMPHNKHPGGTRPSHKPPKYTY